MNERKTEFAAFERLRLRAHSFLAGVPLRTLQRVELLRNRTELAA